MGLNITQTMGSFQFESRENLRNTARDILQGKGASRESMQNILEGTIFNNDGRLYSNSQLAIIKAATQVSVNNSLKETLKYLKAHANSKVEKKPVLGEIWDLFNKKELGDYSGELADFEFDDSVENIFAAA